MVGFKKILFLFCTIFCTCLLAGWGARAEGLININTAGLEELDSLPGIGPSKAQAIIDYRENIRPFQVVEDIIDVSGIGSSIFNNIKHLITVGGAETEEPADVPAEEVCGNGALETSEECDDGNAVDGDGCDALCRTEEAAGDGVAKSLPAINEARPGDILINEFVSDPADGGAEWVELFNFSGREISLDGWSLEDGSGAATEFAGIIGASGNGRFFVIEKPKGNLNNSGDAIILKNKAGGIADQLSYGNWGDNVDGNAPAADDPGATARKKDGYNTHNNANDFVVTLTPTKGAANVILAEDDELADGKEGGKSYDLSEDIIISEIFPNPKGNDSADEFAELFNRGDKIINLRGWVIEDNSGRGYKIGGGKEDIWISVGEYLVIERSESGIAFNNDGDEAALYRPLEDKPMKVVKYKKADEGASYSLKADGSWIWTKTPTPGQANIYEEINHEPEIVFSIPKNPEIGVPYVYDSSDTSDEDGDELKFLWDFGDGVRLTLPNPEHTYLKSGEYKIILKVSDGENEVLAEKEIVAMPRAGIEIPESAGGRGNLALSEILPNPAGADEEGEFIEIFNRDSEKINLLNWKLDDGEGGSRPYKFNFDYWLSPGGYYVLDREESGIAVNNSAEAIRLFNPAEEMADNIELGKAGEGESYAFADGGWSWTAATTPGAKNVIYKKEKESGAAVIKKSTGGAGGFLNISLEEIKNCSAGDLIKTKGKVAVKPGVLGSQYFYIVGSPGVQVYSYKKDFPELEAGDVVEVAGELSLVNGERRLKTKSRDDIKVIGRESAPEAAEITCEQIGEETAGFLAAVMGKVAGVKGSNVYLDDGTDEAVIYLKKYTGLAPSDFKEGDSVKVAGIVGMSKNGAILMPRSADDIERIGGEKGKVLGESSQNNEWELPARNKKAEFIKYSASIAAAIAVLAVGFFIKRRRARI